MDLGLNMALKFDPKNFVKVTIKKPLGINLEEAEEGKNSGVFISDVTPGGNAAQTNAIKKGMFLLSVGDTDVKSEGLDKIIDIIKAVPDSNSIELVLIEPSSVLNGLAVLTVELPVTYDKQTGEEIRKSTTVNTVKGASLRNALLEAKLDVYDMKGKATNCGGAGQCGTCVVRLTIEDNDWTPMPGFEEKKLKRYDSNCRLSCVVVVEGDATVEIRPKQKTDSKLAPKSIF